VWVLRFSPTSLLKAAVSGKFVINDKVNWSSDTLTANGVRPTYSKAKLAMGQA
jgi:hypothetical protein